MNFLYSAGGGGKGSSSDGYPPVQLSRPRLKLQPRRLRGAAGGNGPTDQHELPERPLRTHIFMDLVGGGSREVPPRRRSPSLIDRLCSPGRQESWRHRQRSEGQAAETAAGAGEAREEVPRSPAAADAGTPPLRPGGVEELISLDQVDQDCFIVPFDMVDRFLPTGHKVMLTMSVLSPCLMSDPYLPLGQLVALPSR